MNKSRHSSGYTYKCFHMIIKHILLNIFISPFYLEFQVSQKLAIIGFETFILLTCARENESTIHVDFETEITNFEI
jgi:hypothetical protein